MPSSFRQCKHARVHNWMGLLWNLADLFWFFCFLPPLFQKHMCIIQTSFMPIFQYLWRCKARMLLTDGHLYTSNRPIGGWLLLFSFDYGWRRCLSILWIEWCERQCQHVKILLLFGNKIVKTDTNALTNQPEIATITPPLSSRVVGCSAVVAEAEFVENRPTEVDTNRRYSSSAVSVVAERNWRRRRQRWHLRVNWRWRWV